MAQRDRGVATDRDEPGTEEAIPLFARRCRFCPGGGLPTFHGKCTDPFGRKKECSCYIFEESHRRQWDRILSVERTDDLEHDTAKDLDNGLPHDRTIRGWEEDRQRYEERMIG